MNGNCRLRIADWELQMADGGGEKKMLLST
jgi:hypothetical protein